MCEVGFVGVSRAAGCPWKVYSSSGHATRRHHCRRLRTSRTDMSTPISCPEDFRTGREQLPFEKFAAAPADGVVALSSLNSISVSGQRFSCLGLLVTCTLKESTLLHRLNLTALSREPLGDFRQMLHDMIAVPVTWSEPMRAFHFYSNKRFNPMSVP